MKRKVSGIEKATAAEAMGASLSKVAAMSECADAHGTYHVECTGPDGKVKWTDEILNVVTNEGKNKALDEFLDGTAYTANWYLALQNGAAPTINSTYAVPICTELTAYSNGTRPAPGWALAATGTKATSAAVAFNITGPLTVDGVMLVDNSVKGDTGGGGVLYSAGDFTGGSKSVDNGDTLNVTYEASL